MSNNKEYEPTFSYQTRSDTIAHLASSNLPQEFDAVIVGGGIVGAGVARELSIRGISCLLVEKGDFASGTSSRSSKLIHGGLRYLKNAQFGLVTESLEERNWLLQANPHLVQPLEFNLPLYDRKNTPPGSTKRAAMGAGLWMYDALDLFRTRHGRHTTEEVRELFPQIREQGLQGSYYYPDAKMDDAEIVLETMFDA